MFDRRLISNFDWFLIFMLIVICAIGMVAMYSATTGDPVMLLYRKRQLYWILVGFGVILFTILIDYRFFVSLGYIVHGMVIGLLVLVSMFGTGGPGSPVERWLAVGPVFIQPSEFAKFSLVLALAYYFREGRRIGDLRWINLLWPALLLGVPFILILRQPDLGTALMLVIIFVPIIFLAGIRLSSMFSTLALSLVCLPIAWFYVLKPYQKDRVLTFLNPDRDPLGTGYHVIQSKIAVGSGQFWGKGFGGGTQGQLNFLPAHHTDFIFSVFSEEWGFVGAVSVLVVFLLFALWALSNVLKTKDRISAILTVGIVVIITSQVTINIGMVLGLMPVVGVPLPFFSYGGSSMLSMMFGVGLLLNIRMRRFQYN
ncbi:MAG: rod shape-determining protein RodA [SAR324 cluster bacterium]|nr:rod shape-determining protein RodA [SAR324 cluster bacterium]